MVFTSPVNTTTKMKTAVSTIDSNGIYTSESRAVDDVLLYLLLILMIFTPKLEIGTCCIYHQFNGIFALGSYLFFR